MSSDKLQNVSQLLNVSSLEMICLTSVKLVLNVTSSPQSVLGNMSTVCRGCCQNQ